MLLDFKSKGSDVSAAAPFFGMAGEAVENNVQCIFMVGIIFSLSLDM